MKKSKMKRFLSVFLSMVMILTMTVPTMAADEIPVVVQEQEETVVPDISVEEVTVDDQTGVQADEQSVSATVDYVTLMNHIAAKYTASEDAKNDAWKILEFTKLDKKSDISNLAAYETAAEEILKDSKSTSTDIAKTMIVLSALGYDASDWKDQNAVKSLLASNREAVNAKIFALNAMDSGNYYIPAGSTVTRDTLVEDILRAATSDHGWAYKGEVADPDMTGMAITALAPYYNAATAAEAGITEDNYAKVKTAVDAALTTLSSMQKDNGAYESYAQVNSDSTAMVVMALASVGVDANTDARFIKSGNSALAGLLSFATEDGTGVGHENNTFNEFSTEQALRALISYHGFKTGAAPYNLYQSGKLDKINVSFYLYGDDVYNTGSHVAYQKWIEDYTASYTETTSAFTLLQDAFKAYGFSYINTSGYIEGVVTPDGKTLTATPPDPNGWMYAVNHASIWVGIESYTLNDGDEVAFYFVNDYTNDWYINNTEQPVDVPVASLTLNAATKSLKAGDSCTLSVSELLPSYAADKTVTWSSDKASVATVNASGKVTAVTAGTANITATAKSGVKATCKITVSAVSKPSVTLNYKNIKLQKGKTTRIIKIKKSSVSGDAIKSAKSSKKSVASVSVKKGVLTISGKKTGTSTITVTTKNGATAKVKVTVQKKVSVTKLTINKKKATVKKGKTVKLSVTKSPVTATDKITWTSSNKKVATVSAKGVVKGKKKGTVTITAKSANGKKVTCKITVK